jgi:hypothetical protein
VIVAKDVVVVDFSGTVFVEVNPFVKGVKFTGENVLVKTRLKLL